MKAHALLGSMLVATVAACTQPVAHWRADVEKVPAQTAPSDADSVPHGPPVIQVRDFPGSSLVSVYAWDVADAWFGLSTDVTRRGTLVGGVWSGDHRLFLSPFQVWYLGGFSRASVVPGRPLRRIAERTDAYSCLSGDACTPMAAVGVRIPDALLRTNTDSLVVTFVGNGNPLWTITLRRELIAAYLSTVDSLVAGTKRTAARQDAALR